MDDQLDDRLRKWHAQIDVLKEVEENYFLIEANEKALEGALFLKADGKNIEERKAIAYSTEDWITYAKSLASLKAKYNNERRILELKIKAYEAEYLQFKIENETIRKGFGGSP